MVVLGLILVLKELRHLFPSYLADSNKESGIVATVFMDMSVVTCVHGCVGSHPRFRRIEVPLPELAGEVQRAVQILLVLARKS
jgi:hypothetical protein